MKCITGTIYLDQEPVIGTAMHPKEESAIIILLNGHSVKLSPNSWFLYPRLVISKNSHERIFIIQLDGG